jgi:hypothetical protein
MPGSGTVSGGDGGAQAAAGSMSRNAVISFDDFMVLSPDSPYPCHGYGAKNNPLVHSQVNAASYAPMITEFIQNRVLAGWSLDGLAHGLTICKKC